MKVKVIDVFTKSNVENDLIFKSNLPCIPFLKKVEVEVEVDESVRQMVDRLNLVSEGGIAITVELAADDIDKIKLKKALEKFFSEHNIPMIIQE